MTALSQEVPLAALCGECGWRIDADTVLAFRAAAFDHEHDNHPEQATKVIWEPLP